MNKGKKIGIVTFHNARSYGAQLQAYALQSFLSDLGIYSEIVNYHCKFIENTSRVFCLTARSFKDCVSALMYSRGIIKERKNSAKFSKEHLKLTQNYYSDTIDGVKDKFDIFIAGSDQVWSPFCAGFDSVYFLSFARPEQKYSYAASFGIKELPSDKQEEYRKRLSDFKCFSLREESGANIAKALFDRPAFTNIDPSLLLTRQQWDSLAVEPKAVKPYIFMYTVLKPDKGFIKYALELAKEKGLKIIYLNKKRKVLSPRIKYITAVPAESFVGLIRDAEYVITNSFHATAFSVIYKKKFVVETDIPQRENIRSAELLKKLGLEERIYTSKRVPLIDCDSDWSRAEAVIDGEREKAGKYLSDICGA